MSKRTIGILYALTLIVEIVFIIGFFSNPSPLESTAAAIDQSLVQQDQQDLRVDKQKMRQDQGNPGILAQDQQQLAQDQQDLVKDQRQLAQDQPQGELSIIINSLTFMVTAGIPGIIAWIGALMNLSRGQRRAWFWLMFFFGGIMLPIYVFGGPAVPKAHGMRNEMHFRFK